MPRDGDQDRARRETEQIYCNYGYYAAANNGRCSCEACPTGVLITPEMGSNIYPDCNDEDPSFGSRVEARGCNALLVVFVGIALLSG